MTFFVMVGTDNIKCQMTYYLINLALKTNSKTNGQEYGVGAVSDQCKL